jgi:predicted PurR-regulated permease PerM
MVPPAWAWIGLITFFLAALVVIIGMLAGRVIKLLETLNDKLTSIEREFTPILIDIERTLRNIEPLTKELGERGDEIGKMLANIEKVSDDAQATTGAIRNGIVPLANALTGIYAGLQEGSKALSGYTKPDRKY